MTPTPIQEWKLPGLTTNKKVYIKRDDMTGSTLSGNKVRKLEFLLADALHQGKTTVVTAGGEQSNHCRATAIAARQVGLDVHLILRSKRERVADLPSNGNLLLDKLVGATLHLVKPSDWAAGQAEKVQELCKEAVAKGEEEPYSIPVGGSNFIGSWGYLKAYDELLQQGLAENYDDIVVATGSGGTLAGLCIGNWMNGSPVRIHAIAVCDDNDYFYDHVDEMIAEHRLNEKVCARDIVNVIDVYKGKGYAISTEEELAFIEGVAKSTGILLDRVYSGKAAFGLVDLLNNQGDMFKGDRILFVHTGGVFGLYDGEILS